MRKYRILFFIFGMGLTVQAAADDIHVAAATNLTRVLEEIAGRFES